MIDRKPISHITGPLQISENQRVEFQLSRADHYQVSITSWGQTTTCLIHRDAELIRSLDSTVIYDPHQDLVTVLTGDSAIRHQLSTDVSLPISLTNAQLRFWSKKHQGVVSLDFASESVIFEAFMPQPPVLFENGFFGNGFLGIGPNVYPIDVLLKHDPTIRTKLGDEQIHLPRLAAFEIGARLESKSQYPSATLKRTPEVLGSLDGSKLMITFFDDDRDASAAVVDFETYLNCGGIGFFDLASYLSLLSFKKALAIDDICEFAPSTSFDNSWVTAISDGFLVRKRSHLADDVYFADSSTLIGQGTRYLSRLAPLSFNSMVTIHQGQKDDLYVFFGPLSAPKGALLISAEALHPKLTSEIVMTLRDGELYFKVGSEPEFQVTGISDAKKLSIYAGGLPLSALTELTLAYRQTGRLPNLSRSKVYSFGDTGVLKYYAVDLGGRKITQLHGNGLATLNGKETVDLASLPKVPVSSEKLQVVLSDLNHGTGTFQETSFTPDPDRVSKLNIGRQFREADELARLFAEVETPITRSAKPPRLDR